MRFTFHASLTLFATFALVAMLPAEARAHQADRALRYGGQVCDALASTPNANPRHLRGARQVMETLAVAKRDYDRLAREARQAHSKAGEAQSRFRALEVKLAKDCKGKNGPICYVTRKRADMAKKKFDRLVAEFHRIEDRRRAAEQSLAKEASAAMDVFRRLATYAKRR